jgi:hypothetical protein
LSRARTSLRIERNFSTPSSRSGRMASYCVPAKRPELDAWRQPC